MLPDSPHLSSRHVTPSYRILRIDIIKNNNTPHYTNITINDIHHSPGNAEEKAAAALVWKDITGWAGG
jgi:hypothetical protein